MYATFVAADLDTKARCKLACGRVLVGKYAPATSATFVLSHRAVFFMYFSLSPEGYLFSFIYHLARVILSPQLR